MGSDTLKRRPAAPALAFIPVVLLFGFSMVLFYVALLHNEPWWDKTAPTVPVSQINTHAWLLTINTTMPGSEVPGRGHVKYGFGVWGWCEWGNSGEELQGDADCYGGKAWSIPNSAGQNSLVDNLDLPPSVTRAMFPCGLLLILSVIISNIIFLIHLCSWKYKYRKPKIGWSYTKIKAEFVKSKRQKRFLFAAIITSWKTGLIAVLLTLVGSIPALACAADAVGRYQGIKGIGFNAKLGLGFHLILAAVLMQIVGFVWIWVGGLWYHKSLKVRKDAVKA